MLTENFVELKITNLNCLSQLSSHCNKVVPVLGGPTINTGFLIGTSKEKLSHKKVRAPMISFYTEFTQLFVSKCSQLRSAGLCAINHCLDPY